MPSRRHRRRRTAAVVGVAGVATLALCAAPGTFAAFSDFGTVGASAAAGIWQPDPLAACGDVSTYDSILYITTAQDVPADHGRNTKRLIIVAVADASTPVNIDADNGDCIVTGTGTTNVFGAGHAQAIVLGTGTSMCSTSDLRSGHGLESCKTTKHDGSYVYPIVGVLGFAALSNVTPLAPKAIKAPAAMNTPDPTPSASESTSSDDPSTSDEPTQSNSPTPTPTPTPTPSATQTSSAAAPTGQPSSDTPSGTGSAGATSTGAATTPSTEGGQS